MPSGNSEKLCVDNLRHAEYYSMQNIFDELYQLSCEGKIFNDLMKIIVSDENILLAYRNIKANKGSKTPGTDKVTIDDLGSLDSTQLIHTVRKIIFNKKHGYQPKPVRRKDIPKPNGDTRPLGIPCMWDRLIQQCIKQVLEPICEAKFSNNSYGFRPNRCVEHALASTYKHLQCEHLSFVVEFDIKGFFDNVNHSKLIKQLWALGIHDKTLIFVIKRILKAPIKLPSGEIIYPTQGTPQGGIISPLLANVVLNELDKWVESQWQFNPIGDRYVHDKGDGTKPINHRMREQRKTALKEMFIVRYADDFRIFCRSYEQAYRCKIAITKWLKERLRLEVNETKTRIVNVRNHDMEFLGFRIRLRQKGNKYKVKSHLCQKAFHREMEKLCQQAKYIASPRSTELNEIYLYDSMVIGVQNYYQYATEISKDLRLYDRRVMTILTNRQKGRKSSGLSRTGRTLTPYESQRYGASKMVRYGTCSKAPIYPIGFIKHKNPMHHSNKVNAYTVEGRVYLHKNLGINVTLLKELMVNRNPNDSTELADNKLSLFSAQKGKCGITGTDFETTNDIHCHHKVPKHLGGKDNYQNLILVCPIIHILIHATNTGTINHYMNMLKLDKKQIQKLNNLRILAGNNAL